MVRISVNVAIAFPKSGQKFVCFTQPAAVIHGCFSLPYVAASVPLFMVWLTDASDSLLGTSWCTSWFDHEVYWQPSSTSGSSVFTQVTRARVDNNLDEITKTGRSHQQWAERPQQLEDSSHWRRWLFYGRTSSKVKNSKMEYQGSIIFLSKCILKAKVECNFTLLQSVQILYFLLLLVILT